MNVMQSQIQLFLSRMIEAIYPEIQEFTVYDWKLVKGRLSGKSIADKLKINESLLGIFEDTLFNYFKSLNNPSNEKTASLRLLMWLETISKNLNIKLNVDIPSANLNEDTTFKQVRAIELILRSLIHEQIGNNEELLTILSNIFKNEVVEKWKSSSDETGILSGTTFSELSNILLNKNIFLSIEEIFSTQLTDIGGNNKESLRYLLEDIRIIRNSVAHNKKLSLIQIEVLNNHFQIITESIAKSNKSNIDIKKYFDQAAQNLFDYITELKTENQVISGYVEDINEKTGNILSLSNRINKKTSVIIGLVLVVLLITTSVYFLQRKTNKTTESIAHKTDNINANVVRVFNRFDQLEGSIKNANPIANPKTANDFIVNAYIFKNAGETEKSIDMFNQYFKKTKMERFDLYNDYYQLLKLNFSQPYAEKKTKAELEFNLISAVIYCNEIYGNDALVKINKLKISNSLKDYLFLVKSNEIKTDYISYKIYPYYIKIMATRINLGKQLESIKPFFFDAKGPMNFLRENHWSEMRDQIIMNYSLYQYAVKTHDLTMRKYTNNQSYAEWSLSAAKLYESNPTGSGMTISNVNAYIRCGTDINLNTKFRTMP
ncbi:MAG: STY4199 family HEPN domain-containing protein [Flavobacterium sp.]|jgi:hypothetical protein